MFIVGWNIAANGFISEVIECEYKQKQFCEITNQRKMLNLTQLKKVKKKLSSKMPKKRRI